MAWPRVKGFRQSSTVKLISRPADRDVTWMVREKSLYAMSDNVYVTQTVSVRLSKESLAEVDRLARRLKTDRSEALRRFIERGLREARIDDAMDLLRRGKVSIGRAAEIAGITLYEMLELVREHHIPSGYGPEDLERDLRELGRHR